MMTRNLFWIAAAFSLSAALARAEGQPAKKHTLPADGKAIVILLDTKGGMLLRKNDEPALQVQADGKVIVGNPFGIGRHVEGKITAEELQTLLAYILDQQEFAQITADDLQLKGNIRVTDAATTRLAVDADGAPHELSGRAVETVASRAGPNSPAAHFMAIIQRLRHLSDETVLGGKEARAQYLAAANEKLKAQFPEEKPLQPDDLRNVNARSTGETSAVFQRQTDLPGGKWHMTVVTVTDDGQGKKTATAQKGADQDAKGK